MGGTGIQPVPRELSAPQPIQVSLVSSQTEFEFVSDRNKVEINAHGVDPQTVAEMIRQQLSARLVQF